MFTIDTDPTRGKHCSIFIDLARFKIPEDRIKNDLGLCEDQLTFARRFNVGQNTIDNRLVSSLYYHFGCYRVVGRAVASTATIKTNSLPCWKLPLSVEDATFVGGSPITSLDDHVGIPPKLVLISMRTIIQTGYGEEYIFIHRDFNNKRSHLQYMYPGHHDLSLMARIKSLSKWSDIFTVGNFRLRDIVQG